VFEGLGGWTSLCRDWGSGWGGGVFKKIQLPKYLVKPERALRACLRLY